MKLGEALRKYRRASDLRQKELADKLGISVKHLACIELGLSDASSTIRKRICALTGIVENYDYPRRSSHRRPKRKDRAT